MRGQRWDAITKLEIRNASIIIPIQSSYLLCPIIGFNTKPLFFCQVATKISAACFLWLDSIHPSNSSLHSLDMTIIQHTKLWYLFICQILKSYFLTSLLFLAHKNLFIILNLFQLKKQQLLYSEMRTVKRKTASRCSDFYFQINRRIRL